MKQLLLLLSGLEENPGPAQANVDAEKCDIEEWEMNEVPEEDVVIQNRRTKCAVDQFTKTFFLEFPKYPGRFMLHFDI